MDSLRLRTGGTKPLARMGEEVELISNVEPILLRFRKADTTLTERNIETLYFTRQSLSGDSTFFGEIIPKVDAAIAREQYHEALKTAQKGLFHNPMHLGLLKRACELAQHQKHEELNNYLWQMTELLSLIQHTGDGKSLDSAYRVMEANDAFIYESLWLDTEASQILGRRTTKHKGHEMLVLSIKNDKGKTEERFYQIGRS